MPIKKTRFSRFQTLGGLAAHLAGGAITSVTDRILSGREASLTTLHRKTAKKLLETFADMKGLPMKVGQILSFMDGVIPPEYQDIYRKALGTLQIQAKPYSWDEMQTTFHEEFGTDPESIFSKFDRIPIAAASIGQVYRGQLRDGREVAIKIQYPDIFEALSSDLKNVETVLKTLRMAMPMIDNQKISADMLACFREELNYISEAENQSQFFQCWRNDPKVIIPAPILEHCRRRVLVTEYHQGKNFSEVLAELNPKLKSAFGETLFWFVCHSILTFGLFNADPHPGNFLFQADGRIVFLDFGCVQKYNGEARAAFKTLLQDIVSGKRGSDLWLVLEDTLLIPPGTSENVREIFLDYLLFAMEPILADQPFRFTTAYTARVSELSTQMKLNLAKQVLTIKWREPKREGIGPLVRILFGLNSLLAALEAENDWRSLSLKSLTY